MNDSHTEIYAEQHGQRVWYRWCCDCGASELDIWGYQHAKDAAAAHEAWHRHQPPHDCREISMEAKP